MWRAIEFSDSPPTFPNFLDLQDGLNLLTNRGFVELHNPLGFFIVGIGFLLVMLIVAAGGILTRMVEREHIQKRKEMREAMQAAQNPPGETLEPPSDEPPPEHH